MKSSRMTDSQIMAILNQAEAGIPALELCREHNMSIARAVFRQGPGIKPSLSLCASFALGVMQVFQTKITLRKTTVS